MIEGVTGYLCAPGDHAAVAARLGELIESPEMARSMGAAGFAMVKHRYTWDHVGAAVAAEIVTRLTQGP